MPSKRFISTASLKRATLSLLVPWWWAAGALGLQETSDVNETRIAAPADEYTLEHAQAAFDRSYKLGQFGEATYAGRLVIELLLDEQHPDVRLWSEALMQLASAQREEGQFYAAIQNYQAAIEMLEADSDRLNASLMDPLWGLSRTYDVAGQPEVALRTYQRTLHITHVNGGLYNARQSKLLEEMSEVWFKLGESAKANALQSANVNLAKRNYPGNNLLKLPAMYTRANMLERSDENLKAQRVYRDILRLVDRAEGPESLTLLPALYKLSSPTLYNTTDGEFSVGNTIMRYLRHAIRIAEKNEAATAVQKADAYLAMGNFIALKIGDRGMALSRYHKAWDVLSGDDALRGERDKRFAEPVALNDVPADRVASYWGLREDPGNFDQEGFVVLTYDVSRKGNIENMQIVESHPAGYRDYDVIKHLRTIHFRPKFDAREPVASPRRRYEVHYSYRKEELPGKIREALSNEVALSPVP